MLYNLFSSLVENYPIFNVFRYLTVRTGLSMFTSMMIVFLIGNPLINYFASNKIHNPIRSDGPTDHIVKKIGTPTMGGVLILVGIFSGVLLWSDLTNPYNWFLIFILGFFQALVGWWMVKSGLSDNPYVSPYRLTFHLINAIILFSLLLWSTMNYYYSKNINFFSNLDSDKIYIFISIVIVFITIITGGFMAGSDAGKSFNTYPLMNGKLFPDDYFLEGLGILNLFENTIAINFNHRWLGTISFIYIFSLFVILIFKQSTAEHKIYFFIVLLILSIQFFLGIITLLSNVKISFASMHQTNSIILFAFLLLCYHKIKINQK